MEDDIDYVGSLLFAYWTSSDFDVIASSGSKTIPNIIIYTNEKLKLSSTKYFYKTAL